MATLPKNTVIPAQAGIQSIKEFSITRRQNLKSILIKPLDSRLRGNDESGEL